MVWRREESLRKQSRLLGRSKHAEVEACSRGALPVFGLVVPSRCRCVGGECFVDRTLVVIDADRFFESRGEAIVDADLGCCFRSAAAIVELEIDCQTVTVNAGHLSSRAIGAEHHGVAPLTLITARRCP